MKPETLEKKLLLMELKKLQKKTDQVFQKMRRLGEADSQGVVRCISCGAYGSYKTFDAGHFIPRNHLGVRYNPSNVWPQCKKCNKWLHGNFARYQDGLIKKIGSPAVHALFAYKDFIPHGKGFSWRQYCIDVFFKSKDKITRLLKEKSLEDI